MPPRKSKEPKEPKKKAKVIEPESIDEHEPIDKAEPTKEIEDVVMANEKPITSEDEEPQQQTQEGEEEDGPTHTLQVVLADNKRALRFGSIITQLKQLTNNVRFNFKESGLYIQCMDDAHCCLFECTLDAEWFHRYNVDHAVTLGLNLSTMHKVIHTRHETQCLKLAFDDANPDVLSVSFTSQPQVAFDKFFELPLLNLEGELFDTAQMETQVDVEVDSKMFAEIVNQLTIFDDNLTLTFLEDRIDLVSSGIDGSMKAVINVSDIAGYAIPEDMTLKQSYSLKYVQLMCQFHKIAPTTLMGFGDQIPMTMRYNLEDPTKQEDEECKSYVRIHLAPKIVDEE